MGRNRYNFTNDWFDYNIDNWDETLGHLRAQRNTILEIGSYEGASATWFLDTIAEHPDSHMVAIDMFVDDLTNKNVAPEGVEARFLDNISKTRNPEKLEIRKGMSSRVLRAMGNDFESYFSVVYVDGSHKAPDVLDDITLAWPMLQTGGLMILDDYRWFKYRDEYDNPRIAIDSFLACRAAELTVLHKNAQVIVQKHPRIAPPVLHDGPIFRDLDEGTENA